MATSGWIKYGESKKHRMYYRCKCPGCPALARVDGTTCRTWYVNDHSFKCRTSEPPKLIQYRQKKQRHSRASLLRTVDTWVLDISDYGPPLSRARRQTT